MKAGSVFSWLLFSRFVTFKKKRKDANGDIQYIVNGSIFYLNEAQYVVFTFLRDCVK
ncbi:hypothetical protein ENLAB_07590 [Enterococcus innesii]|uniref:Uncharacterized protein n=1 Tax=Enterococcus innesii TaxID=2839759 RepID=A0ABN6NLU4_9ENTE|nr:hypothetical protein ENLAB_07590 [Enterococcus innesii]